MRRALAGLLAVATSLSVTGTAAAQDDGDSTVEYEASRLTYVATRLSFGGARETVTEGSEVVVTIAADVLFEFDSAELSDEAVALLERTADELVEHAVGPVTIVGHTDDQGTREYNHTLSEERAGAVRDALVDAGVTGLDLQVEGRADDEPAVEGTSEEARAANRRVEVLYETG